MDIILNLTNHCIASEVKKLYNEKVSAYLKKTNNLSPGEKSNLEVEIDLLKKALETLDFQFLRNQFPALAGGTDKSAIIGITTDNELFISIENKKIYFSIHNDKQNAP